MSFIFRTAESSEAGEETVHVQTVEQLDEDIHILAQNAIENLSYTIEYCNDDNHEIISNELVEIMNEGQSSEVAEENDIDNIAYETVVTDDMGETQNVVQEYVDQDETLEEGLEFQIISQEDGNDHSETLNDFVNTEKAVEEENHVEYTTEVTEVNNDVVEYLDGEVNEESAQDVAVQKGDNANDNASTAHSLLPVFDVYMKDGNVTGFVVSDNLISGLKEGVDKEIQTSEGGAR